MLAQRLVSWGGCAFASFAAWDTVDRSNKSILLAVLAILQVSDDKLLICHVSTERHPPPKS
jgi:hypothetical protein